MDSKIKINYQNSRIFKLVKINQFFSSFVGRLLSIIFWLLGIATIFVWISFFVNQNYFEQYFGLDQIFLALFLIFLALRGFLRYFVHSPEILTPANLQEVSKKGSEVNIFDSFSLSLARTLINVGPNLEEKSSGEILKALATSKELNFIFNRIGKPAGELIDGLNQTKTTSVARYQNIAERAMEVAVFENHEQIEVGDILVALAEGDPYFSSFLSEIDISPEDLANIVYWQTSIKNKIEKSRSFLDPDNLHLTGGIGKDWAFGYTPDLNRYSIDLTAEIERQGLNLELVGHDKEINLLEEALNRTVGANAVLIGEPGVGKRTTVLGFSKKVDEGQTLANLAHKHVVELNVDLLISGLSGPGEFTQRITQIFSQAANAGNVIVFIDGIEKILSSGEAGRIDATSVLIPYLSYPEISFIGTTDSSFFNNLIAGSPTLMQRFEKIEIAEPTNEEMVRILEDVAPRIEYHYNVLITYMAIKEVIRLAKKYLLDQPNPEKSISILEGTANTLSKSSEKIITAKIVDQYVSSKANIPVEDASGREKEILINLEGELEKRIVGQKEAIKAIAGALRRSRTGVTDDKKPIGSFLFVGPTGVGKTETAKALAEVYFGNREAMIRFDMSEYQNKEDVYRLIGSPAGKSGSRLEGELISAIRNRPFSLLLFDEIEKANPDILNLFLQVLDEGFITSSMGRKVYFKNSIIIATSNAGANLIRQLTDKNTPYEQTQKTVVDWIQNQGIFRPEFLNRFTALVYYSALNRNQIKEVAKIMIRSLAADVQARKGITLKVENLALEKLSELGYDPEMGARPMARVISEQIENFLATKILQGEVEKGNEAIFRLQDIK